MWQRRTRHYLLTEQRSRHYRGRRRNLLAAVVVLTSTLIAALPSNPAVAVLETGSFDAGDGHQDTDQLAYVADDDIWVSGPHRPINLTNSPDLLERRPTWSPDGKRIAYAAKSPIEGGRSHIWIVGVDRPSAPVPLTSGEGTFQDPSWSPDGRTIAFAGGYNNDKWAIWVKNADGTGAPSRARPEE